MSRIKLYYQSSGYLKVGIGVVLLMIIVTLFVLNGNSSKKGFIIFSFFLAIPFWLIEWIIKYKYFGDILFKREKKNKGEVLVNIPKKQGILTYMELTVVNQENGLGEKFRYYNYKIDKKIDFSSNLESIEFIYLDKSKIILSLIDFKLKESKKKKKG